MLLHLRRLIMLTELRLSGYRGITGDVPAAALAASMPPDLAVLQMAKNDVRLLVPQLRSLVHKKTRCCIKHVACPLSRFPQCAHILALYR